MTAFTKIIEAKRALQSAVGDFLIDIDDSLLCEHSFSLSALEAIEIKADKSKSYIYVFSTKEASQIKEACRKMKASQTKIKLPLISKATTPSDCLYVGSSTTGITKRIKEHLGFGHDSTYSLQLNKWAGGIDAQIILKVYEFSGIEQSIVQLIEDGLHEKLSPTLGKRGSK